MQKAKHLLKRKSKASAAMPAVAPSADGDIILNGHKLTGVEKLLVPMEIKDYPRKRMAAERSKSVNTINAEMRLLFAHVHVNSKGGLVRLAIRSGYDWDGIYHLRA